MTLVITLITSPSFPLTASLIQSLSQTLASVTRTGWLAPSRACDLFCESNDSVELQDVIRAFIGNQPIDYAIQPAENRKKKLLISDMDSTIIEQECIDELADFVGKKDVISRITERAMNGELDFKAALRERVAMLKGLPEATLETAYRERITLMPGARTLVQTMRTSGATCVLVSGGFTFFTSRIREKAGFHTDEANILEIQDGALTGQVQEPILDKEAKLKSLQTHAAKLQLFPHETLAAGDGANDLPMLKSAGLGVAYHAKPAVQAEVKTAVNHNDLTALLYMQGYTQEEFVQ